MQPKWTAADILPVELVDILEDTLADSGDHSDNEDDDTDSTEDEDNDYESSSCSDDSDSDMWQRMNNLNASILSEVTVFSEGSLTNWRRNFKVILVEIGNIGKLQS